MTRKECLDAAAACVLKDRASQYGGPENNFERIADLWEAYLHAPISALDVAMMMSLLKIARAKANPAHADSFVDLAGYAACAAECAMPECDAEPIFRPGDKVQFCQFPHADVWLDGFVERVEGCHCFIRRSNGEEVSAPKRLIRRPCAEGCEELVQHIVDCNPATFHTPSYAEEQLAHHSRQQAHKPTGEELAEKAEEAKIMWETRYEDNGNA